MEKDKKIKIYLGLAYLLIVILFLWLIFNKFSFDELTSYDFIKNNRDYLISVKDSNLFLISLTFLIFTILWVLLLGFGSPIFLLGGFIFGKWIGTILVVFGLSAGATLLYILANYFFKDLIIKKFSKKFSKLKEKFKNNEFSFFLIYRFIGGIPFSISNILPVLFDIKVKNFFFGSVIGMAPQLFIGVSIGAGIEKIINLNQDPPTLLSILNSKDIYIPIIGFIIFIVLTYLLRKKFYKN
ncbi:VTT domain-containing protein [Candidatus Pelagibacter sp.]|nr:VTT domain-containing protein [Candidatus Pelagibacter sp.]